MTLVDKVNAMPEDQRWAFLHKLCVGYRATNLDGETVFFLLDGIRLVLGPDKIVRLIEL